MIKFSDYFKTATGFSPYPWQQRLATTAASFGILEIPTGAGKTEAAAICLYMWRRLAYAATTPRRLVYCLPMRALVEQTAGRLSRYADNLEAAGYEPPRVTIMMGGDSDKLYLTNPEEDVIIVGTQDMLLSRALNRGYGSKPTVWPMEFGLLNNDCLWIMDEIQLMENGLPTSEQLDAFRSRFGTHGSCRTVWMSATIDLEQMKTVDAPAPPAVFRLDAADTKNTGLARRNNAVKILHVSSIRPTKESYGAAAAEKIIKTHKKGTLTLAIVNTVARAQSLYARIRNELDADHNCRTLLVHSRFRADDRRTINRRLEELNKPESGGGIVVATQAAEAGLDVAARVLWTETAPWSSMVQRFGRCNRNGDHEISDIYVMKPPDPAPYIETDIDDATRIIRENTGRSMAPSDLPAGNGRTTGIVARAVIRGPDVMDLFNTAPDMSGNYTDVSAYVRSAEASADVLVAWGEWNGPRPPAELLPESGDMCRVPVGDLKKLQQSTAYVYDYADGEWMPAKPHEARPGQTLMLPASAGLYTPETGWDVSSSARVPDPVMADDASTTAAGYGSDALAKSDSPVTLADHAEHVTTEVRKIHTKISYATVGAYDDVATKALMEDAATLHDWGKAHRVFQQALRNVDTSTIWAKSSADGMDKYARPHFRHEAASALAVLSASVDAGREDYGRLLAYVIMAHHGRIRMSLRDPPSGKRATRTSDNAGGEHAAGIPIYRTDDVPNFLAGVQEPAVPWWPRTGSMEISARWARVGRAENGIDPSWTEITTKLLDDHGPFRLAYLEAVLRAADWRASGKESRSGGGVKTV